MRTLFIYYSSSWYSEGGQHLRHLCRLTGWAMKDLNRTLSKTSSRTGQQHEPRKRFIPASTRVSSHRGCQTKQMRTWCNSQPIMFRAWTRSKNLAAVMGKTSLSYNLNRRSNQPFRTLISFNWKIHEPPVTYASSTYTLQKCKGLRHCKCHHPLGYHYFWYLIHLQTSAIMNMVV